jgi:serine carboxypeptidase-like clade I
MKYSGTTDAIVSTLGTERWLDKMNLKVNKEWKQWRNDQDQIAGFVKEYEGLRLITLSGVGHAAPQWARRNALQMINDFILGN